MLREWHARPHEREPIDSRLHPDESLLRDKRNSARPIVQTRSCNCRNNFRVTRTNGRNIDRTALETRQSRENENPAASTAAARRIFLDPTCVLARAEANLPSEDEFQFLEVVEQNH